jgi:hypothetical protein
MFPLYEATRCEDLCNFWKPLSFYRPLQDVLLGNSSVIDEVGLSGFSTPLNISL